MSLSDSELQRYSRHVIIPGVGTHGQQRLLRSCVAVAGVAAAVAICGRALERSGVRVIDDADETVDCLTIVGMDAITDELLEKWGALRKPLIWAAVRPGALLRGYDGEFRGYRPEVPAPPARQHDAAAETLAAYDTAGRVISLLLGWQPSLGSTELLLD